MFPEGIEGQMQKNWANNKKRSKKRHRSSHVASDSKVTIHTLVKHPNSVYLDPMFTFSRRH